MINKNNYIKWLVFIYKCNSWLRSRRRIYWLHKRCILWLSCWKWLKYAYSRLCYLHIMVIILVCAAYNNNWWLFRSCCRVFCSIFKIVGILHKCAKSCGSRDPVGWFIGWFVGCFSLQFWSKFCWSLKIFWVKISWVP